MGFGSTDHLSFGFRGDTSPMKLVSDIGISAEHPSVFWMFSTIDGDFEEFFCFLSWRLLLLTDDASESDVSLAVIVRFSIRNIGVSCLVDRVYCSADSPAVSGWVGGAEIGVGGLKCSICVKSGQFTNASLCLVAFWNTPS